MPAAAYHNHARRSAHTNHVSCANCTLIQPHTRQLASERGADSRAEEGGKRDVKKVSKTPVHPPNCEPHVVGCCPNLFS